MKTSPRQCIITCAPRPRATSGGECLLPKTEEEYFVFLDTRFLGSVWATHHGEIEVDFPLVVEYECDILGVFVHR